MEKLEFNIDSSEKSVRIDKYLAECCPAEAAERWSGFCEYPYC